MLVLNWGWYCLLGTLGNIWRHFWLSQQGEGAIGIEDVEARDAAKHPTVQRWPRSKELFGPEVQ